MTNIQLFSLATGQAVEFTNSTASKEKDLQVIVEGNLESLLNIRFLDSEYSLKGGRIDTLGIDENNCPVIIEYKRHSSDNIINQGLSYLSWLKEQKDAFKFMVNKMLGNEAPEDVDWSAPRLICIARDFSRFDQYAIQEMTGNIQLFRYRIFGDDLLMLEPFASSKSNARLRRKTRSSNGTGSSDTQYTIEQQIAETSEENRSLFDSLAEFHRNLGDDVQERYLKLYVGFLRSKTISRIWPRGKSVEGFWLDLNLDITDEEIDWDFIGEIPDNENSGVCNTRATIASDDDVEQAKAYIEMSYERS